MDNTQVRNQTIENTQTQQNVYDGICNGNC